MNQLCMDFTIFCTRICLTLSLQFSAHFLKCPHRVLGSRWEPLLCTPSLSSQLPWQGSQGWREGFLSCAPRIFPVAPVARAPCERAQEHQGLNLVAACPLCRILQLFSTRLDAGGQGWGTGPPNNSCGMEPWTPKCLGSWKEKKSNHTRPSCLSPLKGRPRWRP